MKSRRVYLLLGFLVLSAVVSALAYSRGWVSREMLEAAVTESGPAGMLSFIVLVVVTELLWLPRAWGLFVGGALFGPLYGCLLSLVADMISALICYVLGRTGGRSWAERALEKRPKAARVTKVLAEKQGLLTVALLRILPIAHYTVVSYAAGIAGVRAVPYIVGNFLGLLPYAVLYPFIGSSALDPASPNFFIGLAIMAVAFLISGILARKLFRSD